jgi:hypothetical protein
VRICILVIAGLLALNVPAVAQKGTPDGTGNRPQRNPAELTVEAGLTIVSTPDIKIQSTVYKAEDRKTGVGGNLVVKYLFPGYSNFRVGIRVAVSSLRIKDDAFVYSIVRGSHPATTKYASPLAQLGLQGHYEFKLAPRLRFRISPFGGYGYAWAESVEESASQVTAVPIGTTKGFNAGVDLTLKAPLNPSLCITISSGYQRSWMRRVNDGQGSGNTLLYGNSGLGFNINQIPITIGISSLL